MFALKSVINVMLYPQDQNFDIYVYTCVCVDTGVRLCLPVFMLKYGLLPAVDLHGSSPLAPGMWSREHTAGNTAHSSHPTACQSHAPEHAIIWLHIVQEARCKDEHGNVLKSYSTHFSNKSNEADGRFKGNTCNTTGSIT